MKRLIVIATILFFTAGYSVAQQNSFGLKAGLNFSSLPSTQMGATTDYIVSAFDDSYTGYHLGLFGIFVFRGGFFQPELLYTQTGRDMRIEFVSLEQEDEFFVQKYSHLVLPLHAGAKFGAFKISGAPVFSFLINNWNDLGIEESFEANLNKLTLGYQIGAGLQLGNLLLDLRYEGNFSKLGEGVSVGGQNIQFDTRPQQFIISLGFKF